MSQTTSLMSKPKAILGAGGHSRSVIGVLLDLGFECIGIYDDSFDPNKNESILGIPLCGKINDCPNDVDIVLAVGDNAKRADLAQRFHKQIFKEPIIHPSATVHQSAKLGVGSIVFPTAFVNAEATIGENCIINSGCIIEHEATIGNNCHLSIGSIVAGRTKVGQSCFVGAGALLIDQIAISQNTIIGAGSVVYKSLKESGTYVGNPAKRIK